MRWMLDFIWVFAENDINAPVLSSAKIQRTFKLLLLISQITVLSVLLIMIPLHSDIYTFVQLNIVEIPSTKFAYYSNDRTLIK